MTAGLGIIATTASTELDAVELSARERTGLVPDRVGDSCLAEVVYQGGPSESSDRVVGGPPGHPAGLVVVIHEHRFAVPVNLDAVEAEAGRLADPPAGEVQQPIGEHGHLAGVAAQDAQAPAAGTPCGGPGTTRARRGRRRAWQPHQAGLLGHRRRPSPRRNANIGSRPGRQHSSQAWRSTIAHPTDGSRRPARVDRSCAGIRLPHGRDGHDTPGAATLLFGEEGDQPMSRKSSRLTARDCHFVDDRWLLSRTGSLSGLSSN
jgi:hypothetical protein